jgi:hypothetical protein
MGIELQQPHPLDAILLDLSTFDRRSLCCIRALAPHYSSSNFSPTLLSLGFTPDSPFAFFSVSVWCLIGVTSGGYHHRAPLPLQSTPLGFDYYFGLGFFLVHHTSSPCTALPELLVSTFYLQWFSPQRAQTFGLSPTSSTLPFELR